MNPSEEMSVIMHIPSADEIKTFTFLEDIFGACNSAGTSFISPYGAVTSLSLSETDLLVEETTNKGFLHRADDMTLKVGLTFDGKQFLQNGFCKRQNRTAFKEIARERLLEWANENTVGDESVEVTLSAEERWFYGREITGSDLEMAARELAHHDLLSYELGEPDSLFVTLSVEGRECAEEFGGDMAAYLQRNASEAATAERTVYSEA